MDGGSLAMEAREPVSRRLLFALLVLPLLLMVGGMAAWGALFWWLAPAPDEQF
jgi:hypothetical protein